MNDVTNIACVHCVWLFICRRGLDFFGGRELRPSQQINCGMWSPTNRIIGTSKRFATAKSIVPIIILVHKILHHAGRKRMTRQNERVTNLRMSYQHWMLNLGETIGLLDNNKTLIYTRPSV